MLLVISLTSIVYIVAVARTPLGSFNGSLASFSATELGSLAVKGKVQLHPVLQ
jgi:acetyl-CoA C-acetyltransferase